MKKTVLAAAVLAAISSSGAMAGYVDARPQAVTASPAAIPADTPIDVVYLGEAPSDIPPSRGGAKNFGVLDAVAQFAPEGWRVLNAGADQSGSVDWSGAPKWTDTLADVMRASHNRATVDFREKRILVSRSEKVLSSVTGSAQEEKPAQVEKKPIWAVTQDDQWLIRDTLSRWARDANYQFHSAVSWDFPVQAYGQFDGSFEDAVLALMKALSETDRPVRAIFHDDGSNHAVTVVPFAN